MRWQAALPPLNIKVESGLVTVSFVARDMFLRCSNVPSEEVPLHMPKPYREFAGAIRPRGDDNPDCRTWLARHDDAVRVLIKAARATFRILETDEFKCQECNADQGEQPGTHCTQGHEMPFICCIHEAGASVVQFRPSEGWPP